MGNMDIDNVERFIRNMSFYDPDNNVIYFRQF